MANPPAVYAIQHRDLCVMLATQELYDFFGVVDDMMFVITASSTARELAPFRENYHVNDSRFGIYPRT